MLVCMRDTRLPPLLQADMLQSSCPCVTCMQLEYPTWTLFPPPPIHTHFFWCLPTMRPCTQASWSSPHPPTPLLQADLLQFSYPSSLPERLVRRRLRLLAAKAQPFHASRLRVWSLALVPQVRYGCTDSWGSASDPDSKVYWSERV